MIKGEGVMMHVVGNGRCGAGGRDTSRGRGSRGIGITITYPKLAKTKDGAGIHG